MQAVFYDWNGPDEEAIGYITPDALDELTFAGGGYGLEGHAPSDFVWAGGVMAGIVCLQDAGAIVKRRAAVRGAKDVPGPERTFDLGSHVATGLVKLPFVT